MRSWVVFVALLVNVATSWWLTLVEATACAKICYTIELMGFGPGGIPGCSCSGSEAGARTGEGDCNCGQCYTKSQGAVYGYAINSDGTCTYGTDCGSCDYSSSLSISTSSTLVTSTPSLSPTPLPVSAALQHSSTSEINSPSSDSTSPSSNAATTLSNADASSTLDSNSTSDTASIDTSSSISSDKSGETTGSLADSNSIDIGLHTWQVILAICCGVLVLVVAVVSVCSCYCKVRNRLNEHEEAQTSYYNQQAHVVQPRVTNTSILTVATCTKSPAIL